jgi:hypothetical protein
MLTERFAEERARDHRVRFGDDVILHDADWYDGYAVCTDCDWSIVFTPDDFSEDFDD